MLNSWTNLKLYSKAKECNHAKKIYATIAGVTAAFTITGVAVNTLLADEKHKDGLIKTEIEIVDTTNGITETSTDYLRDIEPNSKFTYEGLEYEDIKNIYYRLPKGTKDVVVYNTDWKINEEKSTFEKDVKIYSFNIPMKDFTKEELDDINGNLISDKVISEKTLRTYNASIGESLKNYHFKQDVNDRAYDKVGFALQTFAGLTVGAFNFLMAYLAYIEYKRRKNSDYDEEEYNELRQLAIEEYNNLLYNMTDITAARLNHIINDMDNTTGSTNFKEIITDLFNGVPVEETNMFGGKQNVKQR